MPEIATVVNNINIDEVFLWLITFTDYQNNDELYAVNNLEDITSNGQLFTAFPFQLTLPPDDGQKPQSLTLDFPNVGRELMQLVREYEAGKPPKVKLDLVLASDPNVIEKTIDFMEVGAVEYNVLDIKFTLISSSIFARKTCIGTYNQAEFPGLFWALR